MSYPQQREKPRARDPAMPRLSLATDETPLKLSHGGISRACLQPCRRALSWHFVDTGFSNSGGIAAISVYAAGKLQPIIASRSALETFRTNAAEGHREIHAQPANLPRFTVTVDMPRIAAFTLVLGL